MQTVVLYILGVVIMVVGIALSIALHEVGHLVPAKKFGVRVSQYMVGFGPTVWSKRFGETEYGLKAIPMGGYIAMEGMYPAAKLGGKARNASTGFFDTLIQDAPAASHDTVKPEFEDRVFYKLASWKRIIIMLGGPFMNLLIGIVLYAIVLCVFGIAQPTTSIGAVSACVLPATSTHTECTALDETAPAAAAGIKPGDRFVSIDGTAITSWDQATALIRAAPSETLSIVVARAGSQVTLEATPRLTERYVLDANNTVVKNDDGTSKTEKVGFLGIGSVYPTVQQPVTAVLPAVGDNIVRVGNLILHLPQRLIDVVHAAFGSDARDPNGPISVVGVGRIAGEITSLDTVSAADKAAGLLQILGSLNVALFVFNLIPLMPLDGGHVFGAIVDAVRRGVAKLAKRPAPGPIDIGKLLPLTMVVVVILAGMSALLIYADIVKPISIF